MRGGGKDVRGEMKGGEGWEENVATSPVEIPSNSLSQPHTFIIYKHSYVYIIYKHSYVYTSYTTDALYRACEGGIMFTNAL